MTGTGTDSQLTLLSSREGSKRSRRAPASSVTGGSEVNVSTIRSAHKRIRDYVRETPIMLASIPCGAHKARRVHLKLENLQFTGTSKIRGILNQLFDRPHPEVVRGLVATWTYGNFCHATAHVGRQLGLPTWIFVPTPAANAEFFTELRSMGAIPVVVGNTWVEANAAALTTVQNRNLTYVYSWNDRLLVSGQGTVALEILDAVPEITTLIVPMGYGALLPGNAIAAKGIKPDIRVIGVRINQFDTLHPLFRGTGVRRQPVLIDGKHVLSIPGYHPMAGEGPREGSRANRFATSRYVDSIASVTVAEVQYAARFLWTELGIASSRAAAASVAVMLLGRVQLTQQERVCAVIKTSGEDGLF